MSHMGTMNATSALATFCNDRLGNRKMFSSSVFPCSMHQYGDNSRLYSALLTSLEETYTLAVSV